MAAPVSAEVLGRRVVNRDVLLAELQAAIEWLLKKQWAREMCCALALVVRWLNVVITVSERKSRQFQFRLPPDRR
jgi:hypothetical protein